jgi:tRNA(Arg) A34 adenosine deaminase TadA
MSAKDDQYFLKEAIKAGNQNPKPYTFGALIVKNGQVMAKTSSQVQEQHDPSAHDGILAIRLAGQKLGSHDLSGCTMYCSDQPCVMCFACAIWAGIDRVVYARPQTSFQYEFEKNVRLEDLAKHATKPIKIEQVKIDE